MPNLLKILKQSVPLTIAMMRADAPLYLAILAYTAAGLLFLDLVGARDQAAYATYLLRWATLFLFMMPVLAMLIDIARVVHRFDKRRLLAFRRVFSAKRLAALFSGVALLMAMVLFQGTFTSIKNAMPVWQGGFAYDVLVADADKWLSLGTDPWLPLFAIGATDWVRIVVEWNYDVLWFVICFAMLFFVATSPRAAAIRARYLLCFMLVWIVVGNLFAGVLLTAGPAFYGAVTGDHARFADQLAFLARGSEMPNSAVAYQNYLWALHQAGKSGFASGISAFPSVHVGLVAMNALFVFDWNRRLGIAAFAYVAFVMASSVYLAWHYALDGYAAVVIVALLYFALKRWMPTSAPAATANAIDANAVPGTAGQPTVS